MPAEPTSSIPISSPSVDPSRKRIQCPRRLPQRRPGTHASSCRKPASQLGAPNAFDPQSQRPSRAPAIFANSSSATTSISSKPRPPTTPAPSASSNTTESRPTTKPKAYVARIVRDFKTKETRRQISHSRPHRQAKKTSPPKAAPTRAPSQTPARAHRPKLTALSPVIPPVALCVSKVYLTPPCYNTIRHPQTIP